MGTNRGGPLSASNRMRPTLRFLPLALPFAVLAGAAAWLLSGIAPEDRLGAGAIGGTLSLMLLVPLGMRLVAAQGRADQARPGSIVARTEQRAMMSLLAAAVAGLTIPAMPAAIAAVEGHSKPPHDALLITACAAALGLGVLLLDFVASIQMKRLDARIAQGEAPATEVDFGLGDDVASRIEAGAAYRSTRTVTLAVGDPFQAHGALRRSLTRSAVVVGFIELVALGHGLARDPEAAARYEAQLCEAGRSNTCRQAALLWERAGLPDGEAEELHQLACDAGEEASCMAVYLLGRRAIVTP